MFFSIITALVLMLSGEDAYVSIGTIYLLLGIIYTIIFICFNDKLIKRI